MYKIFFWFLFVCTPAIAGFLEPVSFPKVTSDMSFVDRIALQTAGYEQFESEYDANGNCVSGCSYAAPRLEDELAAMERWNELVNQELIDKYNYVANTDGSLVPPDTSLESSAYSPPMQFPVQEHEQPILRDNSSCKVRLEKFGNSNIPYGSPLGYISCITSPYKVSRNLFGETKIHYGIDLRAKTGTPVYAPASGKVVSIMLNNQTCGNGVIIQHSDGYSTKYCHFSVVSVTRGQNVSSGCMIGRVGNTGRSTGPHLHYSVYKGGNSVNPKNFIEPNYQCCPDKC